MEENRKRHCWECLRRRLVCDFTHPACRRCSVAGIPCPGYDAKPPSKLRWLAPGKVKFHNRKVESKNKSKAAKAITKKSTGRQDVVTPGFEIKTELHMLMEAVEYYNTCIYQNLAPILELGPHTGIYKISPAIFQMGMERPVYIRLSIACMSLSHRMNRTWDEHEYKSLSKNFLHYRGDILRSLRDEISLGREHTSNFVIAGILTLLLVDSQQGISPYWRCHIQGIQRIIMLRGGIQSFTEAPGTQPLLVCFAYLAVVGDTTSPASSLAMDPSLLEELALILERYRKDVFVIQVFPTDLFAETIQINYLRLRASQKQFQSPTTAVEEENFTREAYEILARINAFSPEDWAESKARAKPSSMSHWLLIGNIYQAAVALYCLSSLQSISVLPPTHVLRQSRAGYCHNLHGLLKRGLSRPSTEGFMLWPLIVFGVEAVNGDTEMRLFVRDQLPEMSHRLGVYLPLVAKGVLERFWASGLTHWDECFDEPYGFVTQLAVDTSKLR